MLQTARGVKEEAPETPHHVKRTNYASQVLANSALMVAQAASTVVGGINMLGTVDVTDNGVETTATDAAIFSQVATFWNLLAGVDSADDPAAGGTPLGFPMAAPPPIGGGI